MTSRQRVRNLLNRLPYDKIPFALGSSETASMHVLTYERIKKLLGVADPGARIFSFMFNAVPEAEYMRKSGCDILPVWSNLAAAPLHEDRQAYWKEIELWGKSLGVPGHYEFERVADGVIWKNFNWKCPDGSYYFDEVSQPETDLDEFTPDRYNPPGELPEAWLRSMERQAARLYAETDYCLLCGETITDLQFGPGGTADTLMYLALYPERMKEILEKAVQSSLKQLAQLDQAIGKYVDILCIAQDLGDTQGITMGERAFREIYKPFYRKWFAGWKKLTNMKISMHSCGAVRKVIPDLIECGLDILNPVQTSAVGMEPAGLKTDFGDKLIFFGGGYDAVDNFGRSGEEVYAAVRHNVECLSRGGGYLFAGVHNLPGDVPEEHLSAMLRAYRDTANDPKLRIEERP